MAKENPERMYVSPEFKKIINIEAASKGKSIIEFTKELAMREDPLKDIQDEWNGKWKKSKPPRRFDFP